MTLITEQARARLAQMTTPEYDDNLGFGKVFAPIMYRADYSNGQWGDGSIVEYGVVEIDPAAKVLHYAQSAFEGLKAYSAQPDKVPNFFRPEKNLERLNRSTDRSCMPEVPAHLFYEGIHAMTQLCESLIPSKSGQSLYLRPFIYGTQAELGMAVSDSYTFLVMASPSDVYHSGDMRLLVERNSCRSVKGGTGSVKVGANYLMALQSARRIKSMGFDQSLWLDPVNMTNVEELSGMNLFFVVNGKIITPELNESFLPGVTRDSIIQLARHLGYDLTERTVTIEEVLPLIEAGDCTEVFSCGTAAIVSSVCCIGDGFDDNTTYDLPAEHPVAQQLRKELLAIQEGSAEDVLGWIVPVDRKYLPK